MVNIVNFIYDTYISFFPEFLATDLIVLFIGKIIVLGTVLTLFYCVFIYPIVFVVKLFKLFKVDK